MQPHALEVKSAGPWGTPKKPHVAARCTCGAWDISYHLDEILEAARVTNTTIEDQPWSGMYELLQARHEEHLEAVRRRWAHREGWVHQKTGEFY